MIPAKILFADFLKIHKGRSQQSGVMIQQNNQVESTLLDYKDTASGQQNMLIELRSKLKDSAEKALSVK